MKGRILLVPERLIERDLSHLDSFQLLLHGELGGDVLVPFTTRNMISDKAKKRKFRNPTPSGNETLCDAFKVLTLSYISHLINAIIAQKTVKWLRIWNLWTSSITYEVGVARWNCFFYHCYAPSYIAPFISLQKAFQTLCNYTRRQSYIKFVMMAGVYRAKSSRPRILNLSQMLVTATLSPSDKSLGGITSIVKVHRQLNIEIE